METLKPILAAGIAGGFLTFAGPAAADHAPDNLVAHVFNEMENYFCKQESECFFPEYSEAYKQCMTGYLQSKFSKDELDRILHFKKRNGYFQKADLQLYNASGYGRDLETCSD